MSYCKKQNQNCQTMTSSAALEDGSTKIRSTPLPLKNRLPIQETIRSPLRQGRLRFSPSVCMTSTTQKRFLPFPSMFPVLKGQGTLCGRAIPYSLSDGTLKPAVIPSMTTIPGREK